MTAPSDEPSWNAPDVQPPAFVNRYDHGSDDVVETVIDAVAAANDVDPLDLRPRLGDVVDADALGRLFQPTGGGEDRPPGSVQFRLGPQIVVVDVSEEAVAVYDAPDSDLGAEQGSDLT